jgi:hypothetical protein
MEVDLDVSPAERLLQLPGTFSWAAPTRPPVKAILPGRKLVNLNLASVLILRCRLVGAKAPRCFGSVREFDYTLRFWEEGSLTTPGKKVLKV